MGKQFQSFSRTQGNEDQSKTPSRLRIMLQIVSSHSTDSRSEGKIIASSSKFPIENLERVLYF